jgi:urease accessory protein
MWRLLQLADGAFPTGGFVHSGGLEAAVQLGEVADARAFAEAVVWQTATAALPFVRRGHRARGAALAQVDAEADAFLVNHVANRASRAQGRALAATCARAFAIDVGTPRGHLAPIQGAVCAALGLDLDAAFMLALHGAARGALSAAVRLGIVGPLEAQAIHAGLPFAAALGAVPDAPAHTAPIIELVSALHDRLYSRMFQS